MTPAIEQSRAFGGTHVEVCFLEAFDRVINTIIEEPQAVDHIHGFVAEVIGAWVPSQIFDPASLARIVDNVFSLDVVRDFLFRLTSQFLQRLVDHPDGRANYTKLLDHLVFSLDMHTTPDTVGTVAARTVTSTSPTLASAIPDEVGLALPQRAMIAEALQGNKWLVTLLLIHFYVPMPQPAQASKK